MDVDAVGRHAAGALRDAAALDCGPRVEDSLESLFRRARRRRVTARSVVGATAALGTAAALAIGVQLVDGPDGTPRPAPQPTLGEGYDVIATATSPSGTAEAVATYREGLPAVVLVRTRGGRANDVVWSAPTAHERGDPGVVSFPAAVTWSPDGSRIAIIVGRRHEGGAGGGGVDLTLLTVNRDGTARRVVAELGTCTCQDALPVLEWFTGRATVNIPDGPDRGMHEEEMPR